MRHPIPAPFASPPPRGGLAASTLLALAACWLGGCVERTLIITTEPVGATVTVNQSWTAKTESGKPAVYPMKFYGVYDIRVEHPDYYPLHVAEPIKAPLHQKPGFDFASEVLMPGTVHDRYELHYRLQPKDEADPLDDVIARAEELRGMAADRREARLAKDAQRGKPFRPPFLRERNPKPKTEAGDATAAAAVFGLPAVDSAGAVYAVPVSSGGVGVSAPPSIDQPEWPDPAARRDTPPPSAAPAPAIGAPALRSDGSVPFAAGVVDDPSLGVRMDGVPLAAPVVTVAAPRPTPSPSPAPSADALAAAVAIDLGPAPDPRAPVDIPGPDALELPDRGGRFAAPAPSRPPADMPVTFPAPSPVPASQPAPVVFVPSATAATGTTATAERSTAATIATKTPEPSTQSPSTPIPTVIPVEMDILPTPGVATSERTIIPMVGEARSTININPPAAVSMPEGLGVTYMQ